MLASESLASEEFETLGFWWLRNCSRSRSLPAGKPLDDRSRSSHFEPDLPVDIEQSICDVIIEMQRFGIWKVDGIGEMRTEGKFGLGF